MAQVIGVIRPNFLSLTLICIVLAAALSLQQGAQLVWRDIFLVTLLGLSSHISVNAFNEYFDFKSGLDFKTQPTPFSGGSGTLVAAPELANSALTIAIVTLTMTVLSGLVVVWLHGWHLLWLGVLGVVVIYSYTQYLNRSPILCLLAPGVGFGLCMTLGAAWVLGGGLTPAAWVVALMMMLLVSNLLLLNQFPDIEADRAIGRRHLPIVWGEKRAAQVFISFYLLAYILLLGAVVTQILSPWTLLAGISLGLAWPLLSGVSRAPMLIATNIKLLGLNVAVIHLMPLLMAVGLVLSWWVKG